MYNNSYNDRSSRSMVRPDVDPNQPLPMMVDRHGNPVRASTSQLRRVKGEQDLMERALSRPTQSSQVPQQRRASGIPQPVQRKVVRQDPPVKKVNLMAHRTQPNIIPSTPDTVHRRHSTASTSRTISVRRSTATYWRGLPFMKPIIVQYAKSKGLAVRKGDAQIIDVDETWFALRDKFFEETGIRMSMRELGRPLPILAFYSNHEMDRIKQRQKVQIRRLLLDMGYEADFPLVWYTKKVERSELDGRSPERRSKPCTLLCNLSPVLVS
ncbi:hypothetical protein L226DRAFT_391934 [Lentinus tigrinus ALCF2SS1-7]|uniref:uncharacterized protein n=1 Tax=Lentinus tigrinus ALCF2SS1-7 TaxID=1328758 RepID=UPI001165F50C|nr:hypothetical protein L226DRAFT_391934 [Lentinus tigrinus ALCF2SS1-7]